MRPHACVAQVHVIFTHKEKNYLIKKDIPAKTDQLTHVYTLVLKPDNTFKVRAHGHGHAWRPAILAWCHAWVSVCYLDAADAEN